MYVCMYVCIHHFIGFSGICGSCSTVSTFFAEIHSLYVEKGALVSVRLGTQPLAYHFLPSIHTHTHAQAENAYMTVLR